MQGHKNSRIIQAKDNTQKRDNDPLENVTCKIGDGSCATKHVSAIQRSELFHTMNESQKTQSLLRLQQQYGNRFVQRVIDQNTIQTKLTIGRSGDKYELEANRVANQISDEDDLPMTGISRVGRQYQTKIISEQNSQIKPDLETRIKAVRGQGQPLPESVRAFFEQRLGYDLSSVRIHTGGQAADLAGRLNARAFTLEKDIVFGSGQYTPETKTGRILLAHELTHVIQQGGVSFQIRKKASKDSNLSKGSNITRENSINFSISQPVSIAQNSLIQMYGTNVHYDLTQREARGAGFSNADADVIADADEDVDRNWTHPSIRTPLELLNPFISGSDMLHFPARSAALVDVMNAVTANNLRGFGYGLHRYQDSYSHSFPPGVVSPQRIANSWCQRVPLIGSRILNSNPSYGRMAVLKHACLGHYPDDYNRNPEQNARDTGMRNRTKELLNIFFRRRVSSSTTRGRARSSQSTRTSLFPSYSEIVADNDVQNKTNIAWRNTLNATTPNGRREEGFWIRLNMSSRRYEFTATVLGPVVGPGQGASLNPGSKPSDTSPGTPNAIYTISLFHTHTPTTHRPVGRGIGPSAADRNFHNANDVVGVVYDYVESPRGSGNIPAGHPLNSAAQTYHVGPNRRRR
jgi:hypothetical protein